MSRFNAAVFTSLLLVCGYVGIGLLIEAATQGDAFACLTSASALVFAWLGLKTTYKAYYQQERSRGQRDTPRG